jgi:formylglycine-generating enzyme required for sulfatase activity
MPTNHYALAILTIAGSIGAMGLAAPAHAQYGFDFATIGSPGNAPYNGDPKFGTLPIGRGSVAYEYKISKLEVTTIQWMTFMNTFSQTANPPPYFKNIQGGFWGAGFDISYPGPGYKYKLIPGLPSAEILPVSGISYHMGMLYANWLHNDQSPDPAKLMNGAYDMSKLPTGPNPNQKLYPTHEPGAKFWIPTMDEWIKAAHYDPNKFGSGQAGWWDYRNSSDEPGISGPPGMGTTSGGWEDPKGGAQEWLIPLGAYPQSKSPWGLLDTSGGAFEWTEEITSPVTTERVSFGPAPGGWKTEPWEHITSMISGDPYSPYSWQGLRIAAAVPSPGASLFLLSVSVTFGMCKRRTAGGPAVRGCATTDGLWRQSCRARTAN